jgi:hypothetical protein
MEPLLYGNRSKGDFPGRHWSEKIQNGLGRILAKIRRQNLNSLEVAGIMAKHFLGVPYVVVSAHSSHIQQSCYLDGAEKRRVSQRDAEWARG